MAGTPGISFDYHLIPRSKGESASEGARRWRVDSTSNTSHAHLPLPLFSLLSDGEPTSDLRRVTRAVRAHARSGSREPRLSPGDR